MKKLNFPPFSYSELVKEICELAGLEEKEVEEMVWKEALNPGINVKEEALNFGIDFHIYNEKMEKFYKESVSFIIECSVEFCRPGKQEVLRKIKSRIENYLRRNPFNKKNLLMFGDGTGFDTVYLYKFFKDYINFFYFDVPGSKTFNFAIKNFEKNRINVKFITEYKNIANDFFDIIISLEVLEHLPEPIKAIEDFSKFLKREGIILLTESLGAISPNFPTHLKSSSKYKGKIPFIALKYGLLLTYYSKDITLMFRPMEFTKKEKILFKDRVRLLLDKNLLKPLIKEFLRKII